MKTKQLFFSILALVASSLSGGFAQEASDAISIEIITTIDYPGDAVQTVPRGLNDRGDVVGTYTDSAGVVRAFIRFADGSFSLPIVEPNDAGNLTSGEDINNRQLACGWYSGSDGFAHGYFLDHGAFTEFDVEGAEETIVDGLNEAGDFVGNYTSTTVLAAAFSNIGGVTRAIAIPGDRGYSFAYVINRSRQIAGGYYDGVSIHGFWQDSDGTVHAPFDPPRSLQTLPFGLNDQGWVVGRFTRRGEGQYGIGHAFISRLGSQRFFVYDYPGTVFTSFAGINSAGLICGRYSDDSGLIHGFLAQVVTDP